MHELAKAYEPGAIELRWAEYWVAEKLFVAGPPGGSEGLPVFSMLLPPPNVTGQLHMGHMLNHTEADIMARWHRMRGHRTLWIPGTDHAGIATQMMVERQLAAEGKDRRKMGREKFIERVWQWREHYGGAIQRQMKRLGDSVDWSREYFTMDEPRSEAVREAFVRLYEEGLIYRGSYIVNWCPGCMTAISDLEVQHEETIGKLYEVRYPIAGAEEFITVGTTRPETMLGDTAVAVHPSDERYRRFHGRKAVLPLAPALRKDSKGRDVGREIPILSDDFVSPEFGTGAVKVTPAHDPNDFQAGRRHSLPQINVMDESAHMNQNAGAYAGLDRFAARQKIVQDLAEQGLLATVHDHKLALARCARSGDVVEPRLSTQWFVKVQPLAERAIAAAESGEISFTPENYAKIYFEWMRNIHDWCISRQLWWGHRIPAWHCAQCKAMAVARRAPAQCAQCGGPVEQDSDVLDTWFSSALLPFSSLGWPGQTRDLDIFYPTSLLITGSDILFFWVARMIMMGCHFMQGHAKGSAPFQRVYIHALVRDAERQKMSKTKGNVIDPIEVIEKYGTDAVRFTLAAMASPGTDIAFSEERTDGYRAFANKIWNAARFIFMNVERAEAAKLWGLEEFQIKPREQMEISPATLEDRWIASRLSRVAQQMHESLEAYRFHDAANLVYQFFRGEFCDWYIEIVKPRLTAGRAASSEERACTRAAFNNLLAVFEASLRLLSPFMPFLTEELWHALYDGKPPLKSIALAPYPRAEAALVNDAAERELTTLQELIVAVRNIRAELKVETRERVSISIFASAEVRRSCEQNRSTIEKMAGVETIAFAGAAIAPSAASRSTPLFDVAIQYEKKVDAAAERERLSKEIKKMEAEGANAERQLGNEQFLGKAPAHVVEGIRRRASELDLLLKKARRALEELR